ncbi:MAG: DUF4065 domain-containing protein [Ruminococcaceae bacterium]|nr:DUF4065 domain-containing protein [Oscillospiraceae bacterium]
MDNKTFCLECGCDVNYSIVSEVVEIFGRGVKFCCAEMSAYCNVCGEKLYVPEINDANVNSREEAYRKAMQLISVSEIQDIMEKYNIGAGPLAKLLGFGEITINRYLSGQLPSKAHSEKLFELKNNRQLMERLLEDGKDLITTVAYTKCKSRLNYLNELFGRRKIDLIAQYILTKSGDITPLALQKLLYYSQAFYYALFNKSLFDDDCQAWAHGPVFPSVYYKYKEYGYDPIEKNIEEFESCCGDLSVDEISFLDAIITSFGCYSGTVLRAMTHCELPWIEARGNLRPSDRSVSTIKRKTINVYFADVIKKNNIQNPCDIAKYSRKLYEKIVIADSF